MIGLWFRFLAWLCPPASECRHFYVWTGDNRLICRNCGDRL